MRTLCLKLVLVFSVVLSSTVFLSERSHALDLSDFLWKNRLLLVFAPHEEHEKLKETFEILELNYEGLEDRQMVVIRSLASRNGQDPLRRHFNVNPEEFRIVLIGKDGGPKDQTDHVVDICAIFGLIDAMPMRQQEMALDSFRNNCSTA